MSDSTSKPFFIRFVSGLGLAGMFWLLSAISAAQAQWPLPLGSLGEDEVVAVTVSPGGDVFVVGHFSGALETEVGTVTSQGFQDVFIARVTQAGQLVWLRSAGGAFEDEVKALTLDDGNNVYIVGKFSDRIELGSNLLPTTGTAGEVDGFVAKLDGEGTWKWAKAISGPGLESADSIITLPGRLDVFPQEPESVAVVGSYECLVDFGDDPDDVPVVLDQGAACLADSSDIYLVRYASNTGVPIVAVDRGAEATGAESATHLIRDEQNRVWLAGAQVVGGRQTRLSDNFADGLSGWLPEDTDFGVVDSDPQALLSGSQLLGLRGTATSVSSPVVGVGDAERLIVEMDIYRGTNYPGGSSGGISLDPGTNFPCIYFFLFDTCRIDTETSTSTSTPGARFSARPQSNEDFIVEYLTRSGGWVRLGTYSGNGTGGELFAQRGATAFQLEGEEALHPGFQLRASLTGGRGEVLQRTRTCTATVLYVNDNEVSRDTTCTTTTSSVDAWQPWWHVDNVEVTVFPRAQPFILRVDNILNADADPSFGDEKNLELGLDITGLAADPTDDRLIISGNRTGTPGLDNCNLTSPSANETGTYLAALNRSTLNCEWAKTSDGGEVRDLVMDQAGNMYVTGLFRGRIDFTADVGLNSTDAASGDPSEDVFIARYVPIEPDPPSPDDPGNALLDWATGGRDFNDDEASADFGIPAFAGGTENDAGLTIATDGVATLYVGGRFRGTSNFGPVDTLVAERASDGFVINLGTNGKFFQEQAWLAGVPLTPPEDAEVDNLALPPEFTVDGEPFDAIGQKIFSWTKAAGQPARLIPLQPFGTIEVKWRKAGELPASDARVLSLGSIAWPNQPCDDVVVSGCYQVHVIGAPVQAEPASGDFRIIEVISPNAGSSNPTNDSGQFSATRSGTASIVYVNGPQLDPLQYPTIVEIVRTLPYTAVPLFIDDIEAEIGQPITDPFHNEPNRNGFVVNANAYYDGNGPEAAYNRSSRTGPIIPVNRYSSSRPQDQGRALAVAWYRANGKGVYWPAKAVSYQPRWPFDPERIVIASQQGSEWQNQQPLDPLLFPSARVYVQNDFSLPGYNPNDEHAFTAPSSTGSGFPAVFALRSDFGANLETDPAAGSDPYVLVKYFDEAVLEWRFRVFRVDAIGGPFTEFRFSGTAATTVNAPYPVRLLPNCPETFVEGQAVGEQPPPPFFEDYSDQLWSKSEGTGAVRYYYPAQPGFFTDLDNDDVNDIEGLACVPWLPRLPFDQGGTVSTLDPISVFYEISWPEEVPLLTVGETLLTPKRGLPDILNQAAVQVVYDDLQDSPDRDEQNPRPSSTLAQLVDPLNPRAVYLEAIPSSIAKEFQSDGTEAILGSDDGTNKLPVSIRDRLRYDPLNKRLILTGIFDESGAGDPFLLFNVLSKRDRVTLKMLNGGDGNENQAFTNDCQSPAAPCTNWDVAVEALFRLSRNPRKIEQICLSSRLEADRTRVCDTDRPVNADDVLIGLDDPNDNGVLTPFNAVGARAALTAGAARGKGKMTVAFNNSASLAPLPVSLEVIDVGCLVSPLPPEDPDLIAPYQGQINVLAPENIFDEQLVLRHGGDFGGNTDALDFQWFFQPDTTGRPPALPPNPETGQLNGWIQFPVDSPRGAVEISIEGANIQTLSDNWYLARYRGLPGCETAADWSLWAGSPGSTPREPLAQLAEGWVKRVLNRLNPFEARVQNFAQAATNNFASMLVQLGERYEGPIALNNDPDNLNSIGLIEAYTTVMRRALQLSVDGTPPVNFGPANTAILLVASRIVDFYTLLGNEAYADAQDPTIGITTNDGNFSLAPSIFNFQNQLASLLEEELVLLRGRDTTNGPVTARPVYNRLFWNFTTGDGEVAYAQSYNISDQNFDGVIDEFDARIQFPQGHGDAWGHYLTANKMYYDLIRHPFYTWEPRTESILVAGVPIEVDFLDERQFAETAAAKARAGAEIVDLTYRNRYVAAPQGQYQGYTDTNTERAWGLSEWGRRAGMGAYFDWVTTNSILPSEDNDPSNVGIRRIDRSTIRELGEIASHYYAIQGQVDEADAGLNPLGLATGVVPFDIDVAQLDRFNKTQFEQVADRAMAALQNAVKVWDYANELNNQLRRNQNTVDDQRRAANAQENDFSNQLIEIFGYPYADDIGPGGTYPAGYNGPDMYHYMLIDVPQLVGTLFDFDRGDDVGEGNFEVLADGSFKVGRIKQFTGVYTPSANGVNFFDMKPEADRNATNLDGVECSESATSSGCALGELDISAADSLEVTTTTIESPDIGFWQTKDPSWTGQRRAPGRLQQILQQMLQARIALQQSLVEYDRLRLEIEAQIDTVQATFNIQADNLKIANVQRNELLGLTVTSEIMKNSAIVARRAGAYVDAFSDVVTACVPKSLIAGLAAGGDVTSVARCSIKGGGVSGQLVLDTVADGLDIAANATDAAKEDRSQLAGIRTQFNDANLDLFNAKGVIDELIRKEPVARAEIFARTEAIKQLVGEFKATLAEGLRVWERNLTFRRAGAAETQEYRYQDLAFRIFRNDALQKYRAAFDLAARYVYLAASAYDYETNLLGSNGQAGQQFLTDIVRQRNLGQIIDGQPLPGQAGLADSMAQLKLNFDVLKGQMGFNNPQVETNRFSLRRELFRIPDGPEGDELWRQRLEQSRVDDLWQLQEFRQYARPFAPQSAGPQPALVIEFTTNVSFGLNYFGWELGSGDSSYDSSQFATRIRSVGTWFKDYVNLPLAQTPRIYLFPTGADVLRSPDANNFQTRDWQIVDQAIPIPFPVGDQDLERFDWLPITDNISGSPVEIRRYGRFPAFNLDGPFDDSEAIADSRLVGRSVWNRRWLLIIPGGTFLADPEEGLETFINGQEVPGSTDRDGQGVDDILIFFKTYAYSGL